MFDLSSIAVFIPRAVVQGIPLLYGATGEILTEKSGNLNLGIPGIMYVGAISGVIGAQFYEQSAGGNLSAFPAIMIPLLFSLIGSALMGLLYCFLTVTLRANQNVTGLALTTSESASATSSARRSSSSRAARQPPYPSAQRAPSSAPSCHSPINSAGSDRFSCPTASSPILRSSSR